MKLLVKYFAPFDELTGVKEEEVMLNSTRVQVSEFVMHLADRHERLRAYINTRSEEDFRRHMLVALDEGLVRLTDSLKDDDKVKILPPISGGAPTKEAEP